MTETISLIKDTLSDIYSSGEIKSLTRIILEHITGLEYYQLLSDKDRELSINQKNQAIDILDRLRKQEPIQYILGETLFYNLWFKVDEGVLIPRQETEELVDLIIHNHVKESPTLLDIGTGSGCIAISLAKNLPNAHVSAMDISEKALRVASYNAKKNEVNIRFQQCSILEPLVDEHTEQLFDIIVSNPPYIPYMEKTEMERNVLDHEPHLALFVPDNDPLLFYRHIARFSQKKLKKGGFLYLEINSRFGEETVSLLKEMNFQHIRLIKDTFGKDRIISAEK